MGVLHNYLTSNRAKINRKKAIQVLDRYYCPFDFKFDRGTISVNDHDELPLALKYANHDLPDVSGDATDEEYDKWYDAMAPFIEKHGDKEFLDLLIELAPHLKTPFTIHAVTYFDDGFPILPREWHVLPSATSVELNGFKHIQED